MTRRPWTYATLTSLLLAVCAVAAGLDVRAPSSTIQRLEVVYRDGRRAVVPFDAAIQARLEALGLDKPTTRPVPPPTTGPVPGPVDPPPPSGELPPLAPGATRHQVRKGEKIPGNLGDSDQVLLERGGSWRQQVNLGAGGRPGFPLYLGAWGTGPAPIIRAPSNGIVLGSGKSWVLIENLHVLSDRSHEDSSGGIVINAAMDHLTVRRVLIKGFGYGVLYPHLKPGQLSSDHLYEEVISCDAEGPGYAGQGFYLAYVRRATLRRCAMVGNGMGEGSRKLFEHAAYGQGTIIAPNVGASPIDTGAREYVAEDCICVDNAAFALQFRAHASKIKGGVFLRHPLGCLLNGPDPVEFTNNVSVVSGECKGYGDSRFAAGALDWHAARGLMEDNLMVLPAGQKFSPGAHKPCVTIHGRQKDPAQQWPYSGACSADGGNNTVIGWPSDKIDFGNAIPGMKNNRTAGPVWGSMSGDIDALAARLRAGDFTAINAPAWRAKVRAWAGVS